MKENSKTNKEKCCECNNHYNTKVKNTFKAFCSCKCHSPEECCEKCEQTRVVKGEEYTDCVYPTCPDCHYPEEKKETVQAKVLDKLLETCSEETRKDLYAVFLKHIAMNTPSPEEKKCYSCGGKGYYTQMHGEYGAEDFGGEGYEKSPSIHKYPCKPCNGTGVAPSPEIKEGDTASTDWITNEEDKVESSWEETIKNILYANDVEWSISSADDSMTFYKPEQLHGKIKDAIQETRANTIKEIMEGLTEKLDMNNMLDGWQKHWKKASNGRYIENCIECENANRILAQDQIINSLKEEGK